MNHENAGKVQQGVPPPSNSYPMQGYPEDMNNPGSWGPYGPQQGNFQYPQDRRMPTQADHFIYNVRMI